MAAVCGLSPHGALVMVLMIMVPTSLALQTEINSSAYFLNSGFPNWTKFNPLNSGHAILLIVGLCREMGAMTQSEIRLALARFGVTRIRFDNFVYCAELLGWLKSVRKGNHNFFVAVDGDPALDYHLKDGAPYKEKIRWRSDIRVFWKQNDRARFNAITELTAQAVQAVQA